MVEQIITKGGVRNPLVLRAMREVPRHLFGLEGFQDVGYDDAPLPIGDGRNTPQPYIVALMAELLEINEGAKVLEIGTGCGYQTAVLSAMGAEVFSVELLPQLCETAATTLTSLGYSSIHLRCGDGYEGWPEEAPFDAILVTTAFEEVPPPLKDQLRVGANMVIPLGSFYQSLKVVTRTADGIEDRSVIPVIFRVSDRSSNGSDLGVPSE